MPMTGSNSPEEGMGRRIGLRSSPHNFLGAKATAAVMAGQQQAAGIGQHHTAAVPGEQLGAQFMLEQLDLAAERRLRHPQRIGGLAEAAELRHATERPELPDIHCLPIFEGRFIRYNNSA